MSARGGAPAPKDAVRAGRRRRRLRLAATGAFTLAIAVGYFLHVGVGNACGIGLLDVALVCPLGSLAALLATRTAIPQALVSLAAFVLLALVFGRAFCGWLCPVPAVQDVVPGVNRSRADRERRREAKRRKRAAYERRLAQEEARERGETLPEQCPAAGEGLSAATREEILREMGARTDGAGHVAVGAPASRRRFGSATVVLAAVLVSTAVFGFPVFCLVCPVGLTFAFVLLVMRVFVYGEVTWALVAFPAVVLVEVALLPRWCRDICPLGALHALVANGNRTFLPHVDATTCVRTARGAACGRCEQVCPQGISLAEAAANATPLNSCTKCARCAAACPTGSISFPFRPPRG